MKKRRALSLLLAAALSLSLALPASGTASAASVTTGDSGTTYSGGVLAAVNTTVTATETTGSFRSQSDGSLLTAYSQDSGDAAGVGVCGTYTDPVTGEQYTQVEADLPAFTLPSGTGESDPGQSALAESASYSAGDTRAFNIQDEGSGVSSEAMTCLYVGTHCTVWGSTSDNSAVCISAANAQTMGEQFDSRFDAFTAAFGDYWYDADSDGKLAIMCYDIDADYSSGTGSGSYVAGYFDAQDLVSASGYVDGEYIGASSYRNDMDCIHVDTFPGMGGTGDLLGDVGGSDATLIHEFQHLVNLSWELQKGIDTGMEDYLNEAFSMAAEHLICGSGSVADRVDWFNDNYRGQSLTVWGDDLTAYSSAYLFGQYIRTRYAQILGGDSDGGGIYKAVFEARTPDNAGDTLKIIAGLLNTTPTNLIRDFWAAVYLKNTGGPYGFGGETWADAISPYVYAAVASNSGGIGSGGAKYYDLTGGSYTVASSANLSFELLAGGTVYEGSGTESDGMTVLTLDPGHGGADSGASYTTGSGVVVYERDLNLKIAQYVKEYLETYDNTTVYLTRSDNTTYVSLSDRVRTGVENGSDAVISLHLNTSESGMAAGAYALVTNGLYDVSGDVVGAPYNSTLKTVEYNLGASILKSLAALGLTNRGYLIRSTTESPLWPNGKNADYYAIVREGIKQGIPAIIMEQCFLNNAGDYANYLSSDEKLRALARAEAEGIAAYYGLSHISYSVSVAGSSHGSVAASAAVVSGAGQTVTLSVTPDEGYELESLSVTGKNGTSVSVSGSGSSYTFSMPASDVTVTAVFRHVLFMDVALDSYYASAVQWAVTKEITSGVTATTFSPDAPCTRAQVVTFLWRAAGSPEPTGSFSPFTDVAATDYYAKAVLWAVETGVTKGTSDTTFSPDAPCTRAQVVTFLWRYAGSPPAAGDNPFEDVYESDYYYTPVLWASSGGVTSGTGASTFSPGGACIRAQVVTFLYRWLNR